MFLRKMTRRTGLFLLAWVTTMDGSASNSFKLRYEGVIGGMSDARLCYDAPFSFHDLQGIQWFLGVEDSGDFSCLTGTHPEANSSLWQISPDGSVWGKRQGYEFALVSAARSGKWEVLRTLEFPRAIHSPADCLMWMGNDGLYVVTENELWKADFDGNWSSISDNFPELNAYRNRGFVQSQNFVYCWSDEVGILIDKRTASILSFEVDGWPEMLADFEILGATWRVTGDIVQVVNEEEMMQFDFGEKAVLPHQTISPPQVDAPQNFWSSIAGGIPFRSLFGGLLLLFVVTAGIGFLRRRQRQRIKGGIRIEVSSKSQGRQAGERETVDYGFSDSFLEIVNRSSDIISMEDFDELAHGGEKLSPESQRARRSKLFREVNAESKLVMGYDLLVRERDPQDRRKVRYRIQSLPPRIQRIVQAIKADSPSVATENQSAQ